MILPPARRPCRSCPYRRDVPSGIWSEGEYAKLPLYDRPTGEQPFAVFLCHQQDDRACAGWVAVHDMEESAGLRLAAQLDQVAPETIEMIREYTTSVAVFSSGREAAEHGLRDVEAPSPDAVVLVQTIDRKRKRRER